MRNAFVHGHSSAGLLAASIVLCLVIAACAGTAEQFSPEGMVPLKTEHSPLLSLQADEGIDSGFPDLAAMPLSADTTPARELSYTNVVHYNGDGIFAGSPGNLFPVGKTVVASTLADLGWVTYAFNTGGYQPEHLSLDISCNPGSSAYIAYSDYGSGRWIFQQPVTGPTGIELPPGTYLNSFNQFFVAVVTYGGSRATVNSINIEFDNDLVYEHGISGTVLDENGEPMAGQFLFIDPNPDGVQVIADSNGNYTIGLPSAGMYDVSPQSMNATYSPMIQTVDVDGMETGVDFTGTRLDISGRVVNSDGIGLPGVAMSLNPGGSMTVTGADGEYSFTVLADDNYTVEPLLATYSFTPPTANASVSGADVANLDFDYSGGQPTYGIFGNVHESDLSPVAGAYVTLNPGNRLAITDVNGNFGFTGLAEATYELSCQKLGWSFAPPVKQVNISGSSENGADFTGTPPPPTSVVHGDVSWKDPDMPAMTYAVPDLLVSLVEMGGPGKYSIITDDNGAFSFPAVAQGEYKIEIGGFAYYPNKTSVTVDGPDIGLFFHVEFISGKPTWKNFAASYIGNQCTSCHRPDSQTSVSPFLRDYDETKNAGTASNARIQHDTMPPGNPSADIHKRQFQLWRLDNYPLE